MTRLEDDNKESMCDICGMGTCANGAKCGIGKYVKRNTFLRLCHMERKKSEEFVKKVYVSKTEGPRRGRPVVRLKEYMHEIVADRGRGVKQARNECMNRERWRLFCLVDIPGGIEASETRLD